MDLRYTLHYGTHFIFLVSSVFTSHLVTASNGGRPTVHVLQPQQLSANSNTATNFSRRLTLH